MLIGFLVGIALVASGSVEVAEDKVVEDIVIFENQYSDPYHFKAYPKVDDFVQEVPEVLCTSERHESFLEVARLADDAGFPGTELHTAVAVAYAESLGVADAVGRNRNGSTDTGLWQINSVHGFSNLSDPVVNAEAAFAVWELQGWTAWYAHTPRGGEYGSGERFLEWLNESQCSLDLYLSNMVQ